MIVTRRRSLPALRESPSDRLALPSEWSRALPVAVAAVSAARRRRWRPLRRYRRGFTRGVGIGLVLGILSAPRSGRESRALLRMGFRWWRRVRRTVRWLRAR